MANNTNQVFRNILSVIAGVLSATLLFMVAALIMLLVIASKVHGRGEETDLENITQVFDIVSFLVIFTCCFIGGYLTGRISVTKDMIHGAITGLVLTTLLAYSTNFDQSKEAIVYYAVILPFTLVGTYIAIRKKKKKISADNPPSLSGRL
jgi:hypothetical protein